MTTADDDRTFAAYKRAYETERKLKPAMREAAIRRLHAGATNQELAAATGLTAEYFRKLAREIGADNRQRPPTVGRDVQAATDAS